MNLYRIDYAPAADKALRRIRDARLSDPIKRAVAKLADDPRPTGSLKLVGEVNQWRVRVGDWRIVYRIDDGVLLVLVVRLHRVAARIGRVRIHCAPMIGNQSRFGRVDGRTIIRKTQ